MNFYIVTEYTDSLPPYLRTVAERKGGHVVNPLELENAQPDMVLWYIPPGRYNLTKIASLGQQMAAVKERNIPLILSIPSSSRRRVRKSFRQLRQMADATLFDGFLAGDDNLADNLDFLLLELKDNNPKHPT